MEPVFFVVIYQRGYRRRSFRRFRSAAAAWAFLEPRYTRRVCSHGSDCFETDRCAYVAIGFHIDGRC